MNLDSNKLMSWLQELIDELSGLEEESVKLKNYYIAEAYQTRRKTIGMILEVIKDGAFEREN